MDRKDNSGTMQRHAYTTYGELNSDDPTLQDRLHGKSSIDFDRSLEACPDLRYSHPMVDRELLGHELQRMKKLIASDPRVLARFDRDGNGHIDGEEWEEVRKLVVQRLERQQAEQAERARLEAEAEVPRARVERSCGEELGVAQEILERDLVPSSRTPRLEGRLADYDEIVIAERGLIGQALPGMVRREYELLSRDGQSLAMMEQCESDMVRQFALRTDSVEKDRTFKLYTPQLEEVYHLKRRDGIGASDRIDVMNGEKLVGFSRFEASLRAMFRARIAVHSSLEGLGLVVKNSIWKPWTYQIIDGFDETVGTLELGWSGLGCFLDGGNLILIRVSSNDLSPEFRLSLIAAALLIDTRVARTHDG